MLMIARPPLHSPVITVVDPVGALAEQARERRTDRVRIDAEALRPAALQDRVDQDVEAFEIVGHVARQEGSIWLIRIGSTRSIRATSTTMKSTRIVIVAASRLKPWRSNQSASGSSR